MDRVARRRVWVLFIGISLLTSVAAQFNYYLNPYITQTNYDKLRAAGQFIQERGWTEPILVALDEPGVFLWSLDRSYLGAMVGQLYSYYGKLQELYFLAPPLNESSYRWAPDSELVTATTNIAELTKRFGSDLAAVRSRPVVFLAPESYSRAISEQFAARYEIAFGVFVIPPGALSDSELNGWRLFSASDYTWKSGGSIQRSNWSLAPQILEFNETMRGAASFAVAYRFFNTLSSPFTIRVRLMDLPRNSSLNLTTAPVHVFVDDVLSIVHAYNASGPMWITGQSGILPPGQHIVQITAGAPGSAVSVALDSVEVSPKTG